jgi:hypothetical protein
VTHWTRSATLSGVTYADAPTDPPVPADPPRRRRTGLLVGLALGAVILGAAAGGAILLTANSHPTATPTAAPTSAGCQTFGLTGCEDGKSYSPAPASTSPPPPIDSPVSGNTGQACALNEKMRAGSDDLVSQGDTIARIKTLAADSQFFDIRFAANMLKDRYDVAAAARRTHGDDELSTALDLTTASIKLSTACVKAGWRA